jgi:sulfite reductase (NADPH) flavoprotein alpha-component
MAFARHTRKEGLLTKLRGLSPDQHKSFIESRQFIDLVSEYPATLSAQQLVDLLRPLSPRSYSIASSQVSVDMEAHLTVATLNSNAIGELRTGVASGLLNHRLKAGDQVGVFLEPNKRFRLPVDQAAPLILIAAGTGIAPYRAFLQQLEETEAKRDVWLVFGNQNIRTDFLYQREWLRWRSKGLISKIDGAFSRDQKEKRYVQHVIQECGEQLNQWLDRGAYIYICGGLAMGRDVEQAVHQAVVNHRGLTAEAASLVMADLRRDRRLLKDLY